jgi:pyruvate dehydrogenase E1 component beta subunit
MGSSIGAAAAGARPIVDMTYLDFMGLCWDDLINQLQMRYMFGGEITLPLTITAYSGAGFGAAHHHSKNLYGLLIAIPGLKVIVPSTPYDAKGLLKAAIREDNPVIFLEHKLMLLSKDEGDVPKDEYIVPLGTADVKREGKDVTIVAIGIMVKEALSAADKLLKKGISVEVIDPRTLIPLDKKTIIESVKKTGRLVIIDEEPITGSAAGEISAIVGDEAFNALKAPIKRVCAPDTPIPFSPALELDFWMPNEQHLLKAIGEII